MPARPLDGRYWGQSGRLLGWAKIDANDLTRSGH